MKKIILLFSLFLVGKLFGQQYEVKFNENYKSANENNISIEIHPVQELVYIILANTNFAKKNQYVINRNTEYLKKIEKHFSQHSHLPIVDKFNKLMQKNPLYYVILSGNAYGYKFNFKNNKIEETGIYIYPAKGVGNLEVKTENPIKNFIPELESFAKKTNFGKFYKDNITYYNQLIKEYKNYAELKKQKKWLEDRFDYKINSFRVLTSALINGLNATQTFENNNFKETLLFLPTIRHSEKVSKELMKAYNTRAIFTEIDHNYVGKASEKYKQQINRIFSDREKWLDTNNKYVKAYPIPVKVYDEYLTWGLFILYSQDNYEKSVTEKVTETINETMKKRGFPKAAEFNSHLIKLYNERKNDEIEELYPKLLKWCEEQ